MRFKLDRQFYIPKDATILQETDNAIIYGYAFNGKVAAVAFKGKAQKPNWHYSFRTEEQRDAHIARWLSAIQASADFNAERKHKQREEILKSDIKPGDYFYTSWGYDQTNIDYLIVASVTAKTAVCKMVSPIVVDQEAQQDVLMPGSAYGDTFRMKISGKDTLTGSYPYCNGSKRLGYFSRTSITSLTRETNPVFGH